MIRKAGVLDAPLQPVIGFAEAGTRLQGMTIGDDIRLSRGDNLPLYAPRGG